MGWLAESSIEQTTIYRNWLIEGIQFRLLSVVDERGGTRVDGSLLCEVADQHTYIV